MDRQESNMCVLFPRTVQPRQQRCISVAATFSFCALSCASFNASESAANKDSWRFKTISYSVILDVRPRRRIVFCPRYAWEGDPALCLYALALVRVRTDQPSYLILSGVVCRSCFIMPMQLRLKAIYSEFQARETTDYTLMVVSRGKTDLPSEEQKKKR